jgi:hypothetical protein
MNFTWKTCDSEEEEEEKLQSKGGMNPFVVNALRKLLAFCPLPSSN